MKKLTLIILSFLFGFGALAQDLKVELNPSRPVAGEVFQAYFRIFTNSDEEPSISFNPWNVEVVGKSNQGVSTRTVYANGKLTVTREITVVYDLASSNPGPAAIRDIVVEVGGKKFRHPPVSFTVLKEPEVLADVFVMADVPKKTLFLGEGMVVRYYLYSKVPVSNLDIKKYPKLNNFLKRFLQEPERTERVSVDGQLYMRTQIYAAKLYPEKVGEFKIDPLRLSATYPNTSAGDPFGAFGLNRDFKTRTIGSEAVKIQVKPLPDPVPSHFTGLVGKHDFNLQVGRNKLIVNEPLEIKLTVSGPGALENLEAPNIIDHPALEKFETNGDLKVTDAEVATKVFEYTFLAKENVQIPEKDIVLSYLDPDSGGYVTSALKMPEIVIAGGVPSAAKEKPESPASAGPAPIREDPAPAPRKLAAPAVLDGRQWKSWLPVVNFSLAALAVLISLGWFIRSQNLPSFRKKGEVPAAFRKGHFKLSEFLQWLTPLIHKSGKSPLSIIKDSPLSEESKRYFIDLLNSNDYKSYSARKSELDFKYNSAHFKELGRYIESVRNESSSQPS